MADKAKSQDKKSKFAKAVLKDIQEDFLKYQKLHCLTPLVFQVCNGSYPWPFSEAYIEYRKPDSYHFAFDFWYLSKYLELTDVLQGKGTQSEADKTIYECLFEHYLSGEHLPCLQSLLTIEKLSELNITTIMALHYFKPLVCNGTFLIDGNSKGCKGRTRLTECGLCKKNISYGDTSMGNVKVWHGSPDILLRHVHLSVVQCNLEKNMEDMSLKDTDLEEEENESVSEERENSLACGDCSEDNSDDFLTFVEVKLLKNMKAKSQAIAQAIVNAFFTSSKNHSFFNKFIPSFLATEKYITIILYNCELDILLLSTKLPIWKENRPGELDIMTLIRVWLALNYSNVMDKSEEYNAFLKHTQKSNFKTLITPDAYSVYLKEMQQPLKHEKISPDYYAFESELDDEIARLIALDCNDKISSNFIKKKC